MSCGTPGYIPPEIHPNDYNDTININFKNDIFALGVIFHIL
jgi:serine/threonine protein kinase